MDRKDYYFLTELDVQECIYIVTDEHPLFSFLVLKIDKASMLEEAIEYLKTLQLQVQMMSTMGCVPPMLAMQHMQMPHFHHHHHLGAMGFGMGAFDPRLVAATQFPYPMIPGMPMFGHGHAMPAPPPFPQQAAAMSAGIDGTDAAQAVQQTPGDHPQAPRAM